MKIADLLKVKSSKGTKPAGSLDAVLDKIIQIEKAREAAERELENARRHLENEQARILDGESGDIDAAVTGVVSEKEKLDGLNKLLTQSKSKAMSMLAVDNALGRERLSAVEKELVEVREAIDTRRIRAISEFSKKHNFSVTWPNKNSAGCIHLPALTVEGAELQQIAGGLFTSVHIDEDAGRLDQLLAEQRRINIVIRSTPPLALESLLADRRRK
jgi:hypothetical protein